MIECLLKKIGDLESGLREVQTAMPQIAIIRGKIGELSQRVLDLEVQLELPSESFAAAKIFLSLSSPPSSLSPSLLRTSGFRNCYGQFFFRINKNSQFKCSVSIL